MLILPAARATGPLIVSAALACALSAALLATPSLAQTGDTPAKPPTPAVAPPVAPSSATKPSAARMPDDAPSATSTDARDGQPSSTEAEAQPAVSPKGPAQSTWTTYLYEGPDYRYMVIDEVPQATRFDVIGCASRWCEVQYEAHRGYVRQEIVATGDPANPGPGVFAQPAAALSPTQPNGTCFEANQKGGNGGDAMTVFCGKGK